MKPFSAGFKRLAVLLAFLLCQSMLIYAQQPSLQKLKTYLQNNREKLNISDNDIQSIAITHQYTDAATGIEHIFATQQVGGLAVRGAFFGLHSKQNTAVEANNLLPLQSFNIKPIQVGITSQQAVNNLLLSLPSAAVGSVTIKKAASGADQYTVYRRNASPLYDIPARLVYYNDERTQTLAPAWEVQLMDNYKKHYWVAWIDAASGKILEKQDLLLHCDFGGGITDEYPAAASIAIEQPAGQRTVLTPRFFENNAIPANQYRVYDMPLESPGDTLEQPAPHSISTLAGNTLASPDGWHRVGNAVTYQFTRGNNVWAFQDPSPGPLGGVPSADPTRTAYANNGAGGTPPATEPFGFDYPINLANDPATYQNAAIVNLFYWNNLIHDVYYQFGFTEPAGNFQDSHTFSTGTKPGGVAGDAVLAQAQDGGGTNNANFLTLPDGTAGQMQMYLWTASFPDSLVRITSSTSGIPPGGTKYLAVQGSFNATFAEATNLFTNPVENREMVVVQKNQLSVVGTDEEGCSTGQQSIALPPRNDVSGKIVIIRRGSCSFVEKVLGAQQGGAAGVIIVNNVDGPPLAMGGSDAPGNVINIPAVMVSKAEGELLIAQLKSGATIIGSLKRDNPPAPKRDGDLDNGVIAHEYGHGISNRMTAPNTLSPLTGNEQGGEGWSDFIALYMTLRANDLAPATAEHPNGILPVRSIGNYVTYQQATGRGIRPTPYSINMSVNPATFKDIGKGGEITVPHGVGYIWCTMMYEMLQGFIDQYGISDDVYNGAAPVGGNPPASAKGNNIAMRLIMEGMRLQGTAPNFQRQRNAILRADTLLYNGQHACMIWSAFAKRGLGASALSNTNSVGDEVEAFDVPLTCDPTQTRIAIAKSGPVKLVNGSAAQYTITVTNKYAVPLTGVLVSDTLPPQLTFNSASDGGSADGNVVSWSFDLGANASKTLTLNTTVNTPGASTEIFSDDHEASSINWVAQNNGGLTTWTYTTNGTKAFSGTRYWFAPNTGTPPGSNTTLRSASSILIPAGAELVFIHKYATEARYDGGVLEVSTDNINWTYVPPTKFVRGGYNEIITTTNNPAIGTANLAAFSGTSPGYIVSIVNMNDYAGQNIFIRFRFTCDQTGGTVTGEGWYMDDIYILQNRTEIANHALAITQPGKPTYDKEGTNARSTTSAFVLGGAILPTNLGTLSAAVVRQQVNLSWNTFNEAGAQYFEVERRGAAEREFVSLGRIQPNGVAAQRHQYRFTDANPASGVRYHYRVKMVTQTGEYMYTNIALVSMGGKTFAASIYPNPASNVANVSITNPAEGKVTIAIYDALGKRLAVFNGAEAASQVVPLPLNGLTDGTYWVEVTTAGGRSTLQLIVNK